MLNQSTTSIINNLKGAPQSIYKRDGSMMPFDIFKIREAIRKANQTIPYEALSEEQLNKITMMIIESLPKNAIPNVEEIQDLVEESLIKLDCIQTAKAYIIYRANHTKLRETSQNLMGLYKEITFAQSSDTDIKRENANIDGDTAMGTMLKYGSEGSKYFIDHFILPEDMEKAHSKGDIHIHDKDFYMLTETCCQIDLLHLFKNGFSTGHGYLREPQSIESYSALCCIAIQANQNEMHGGQSIPNFDHSMAPGVNKTYKKAWLNALADMLAFNLKKPKTETKKLALQFIDTTDLSLTLDHSKAFEKLLKTWLTKDLETLVQMPAPLSSDLQKNICHFVSENAFETTDKSCYQAMQALIHNLNTMNSRAGAQVPFSSINYGTNTTAAGKLVIKNLLLATQDGLGNGETPIFPVQIFKVKEGINLNEGDPNYDLFKLAIATSAKRLFPNFSFLDAPFNAQYYKPGDYNTEIAYMGCRTRVMGNTFDPERSITSGRGNLSFTSINLPRLGIEARGNLEVFYASLNKRMDLVFRQLLHRLKIQSSKTVRNYPFLMGQGVWIDSENLDLDDTIGDVIKHGTLTVGFIGLAETLKALTGKHHGESEKSQQLGLEIITHMRKRCDEISQKMKLNFSLIATPAEGLSGRFSRLDKKAYGVIPGITDHTYYTNSFHVPVYYQISAFKKLQLEAPYHNLTNAGHISYVELDGDTCKNLEAFETIIRHMKEIGIGYGSVNHPVDRDPVCGYMGVIDECCPRCGRRDGEGLSQEKIKELQKLYPDMPKAFCAKV